MGHYLAISTLFGGYRDRGRLGCGRGFPVGRQKDSDAAFGIGATRQAC